MMLSRTSNLRKEWSISFSGRTMCLNLVDENVRIVAPQAHALDIALAALAHTSCGAATLHTHWQM